MRCVRPARCGRVAERGVRAAERVDGMKSRSSRGSFMAPISSLLLLFGGFVSTGAIEDVNVLLLIVEKEMQL